MNTPHIKPILLLFALSFSIACITGCSTAKEQERGNLGLSVQTYHQHMRWARWEEAAKFLVKEDRNEFLGRMDEFGDDYKVVSVEIRHVDYTPKAKEATTTVVVEWLQEPEMKVHKDKITETWSLEDKVWLLSHREVKEMKNRVAPPL